MKPFGLRLLLVMATALFSAGHAYAQKSNGEKGLVIFAASSLTNAMQDIGDAFTKSSGVPLKFSFAASSALARQIEAGAHADVFLSADVEWMDYLQARNLIQASTRTDIAGNRLALVAPKNSRLNLKIEPNFKLVEALGGNGKLVTGEVTSVPAGKYAKAALTQLGVWRAVEARVVGAENVRAALAFVDRGEAPLGIVYASDAALDSNVRVVGLFPLDSHPRIVYPVAATQGAKSDARGFVQFLHSDTAIAVLKKYGFSPLQ